MKKSKNEIVEELQKIRNVGPVMEEKLYNAGIYSLEEIKRIGTEDVHLMIDESGGFCGIHHDGYLYAIESSNH